MLYSAFLIRLTEEDNRGEWHNLEKMTVRNSPGFHRREGSPRDIARDSRVDPAVFNGGGERTQLCL